MPGSPAWAEEPDETPAPAAQPPPSPAATSETNTPTPQRLKEERIQQLAQTDTPPRQVWLAVEQQQVLAFWQPDVSGNPVGAVLMLHADGQHGRWPSSLLNLHTHLPEHGWATLSVQLPNTATPTIPARAENAAAASATADTTSDDGEAEAPADDQPLQPDDDAEVPPLESPQDKQNAASPQEPAPDPEALALASILAAYHYLHEQGQYNIVLLGEGVGSLRALSFLQNVEGMPLPPIEDAPKGMVLDGPIRALVLLDARNHFTHQSAGVLDRLHAPNLPILDVYFDNDHTAKADAQARRRYTRKNQYSNFVQKRMAPLPGVLPEGQESRLTKTIRGFLTQNAEGVEIE